MYRFSYINLNPRGIHFCLTLSLPLSVFLGMFLCHVVVFVAGGRRFQGTEVTLVPVQWRETEVSWAMIKLINYIHT